MGFDTYLRFFVALLMVLGLIAGVAWLVRRFGLGGRIVPGLATPSHRRRLSVVEACSVDGKRRLILVRRDSVEHLIMLTANGSGVVVERDIGGGARHRAKRPDDEWLEDDEAETDDAPLRLPRGASGATRRRP